MAANLAIDRFEITGIAPGDHPDPGRLKHLLSRVDQPRLAHAISSALGDFGADDERLIVLRRLELATAAGAIGDPDALAHRLAEGVRIALARLVSMGPDQTVVAFPSRAARIAAFATATARGDAWGKWWFCDLDHLKVLPVSSAIRVALARDPLTGLKALAALEAGDCAEVLECLSDADASDLLDDFASVVMEEGSEQAWLDVFALRRPPRSWPINKAILEGLALLANETPPSRAALAAIRVRAEIARIRDLPLLIEAIRNGSVRSLTSYTPELPAFAIAAIASLKPSTRIRIAAELECVEEQPAPAAYTRFGGALLLWPHLPLVSADLLPPSRSCPTGMLGLIAIASLFGVDAAAVLEDPILREIVGIDRGATKGDMAEWLGQVAPEILPRCSRSLEDSALPADFSSCRRQSQRVREMGLCAVEDIARRLPGLATASLPFLRTNLLQIGAHISSTEDEVRAELDRPPLDVLLSITGLADRTIVLAGGRSLTLERAR